MGGSTFDINNFLNKKGEKKMFNSKIRILLTGSKGIVGTIVQRELNNYSITSVDLPEVDIRDYDRLLESSFGHNIIMHFAWDSVESSFSNIISTDNVLMAYNIYKVAIEAKISRVIMASSIHADNYELRDTNEILSPYRLPIPKTPYGATKVYIEALGRYYAKKGLDVVCIRLGSVTLNNIPSNGSYARFLAHSDLGELLRCCIKAESISNNYAIIYGISNSTERIHSTENALGWIPQ